VAAAQPGLAPQLVLEVLYGVGQVERGAIEVSLIECPIEQATGGADERQSLQVLLQPGLLTDQRDPGIVRTGVALMLASLLDLDLACVSVDRDRRELAIMRYRAGADVQRVKESGHVSRIAKQHRERRIGRNHPDGEPGHRRERQDLPCAHTR
jgi:hypothetical protein